MKVAVTGAAGYLGQVLGPLLEADDSIEEIVAIDVADPPLVKKTKFIRKDVRDPDLKKDFEGCDALVHLAFIVMPLHSEKEMNSINFDGSKNVFNCAAEAGIKKIVHLSSVAAYGAWPDNPEPIYEDWQRRPMPQFYYSRTKAWVEAWLDEFEPKHPDISIVRLRPCIFIGPKINNLMANIANQKKFPTFKGYDPKIQYVWDEDVAEAIMLALKKDVRGAFNLAGDGTLTKKQVAEILGVEIVSISYPVAYAIMKIAWTLRLHKSAHAGWLDVNRYSIVVNCDHAKKELGWSPSLDSAGALERFVREMKKL